MRLHAKIALAVCNCVFLVTSFGAASPAASEIDSRCASCHPSEVAGYERTQMAHSLGAVSEEPGSAFVHAVSDTRFSIEMSHGGMVQRIERGGISGTYHPAYAIGSGTHAVGYVIDLGGRLFQAPICFYAGRGWGMAPGYEDNEAPDYMRPVTANCLACHSGAARPVADTLNRFENPPLASESITCERCHGPAQAHLEHPLPGTIINPVKLAPRARDSVCEQCHLSGEARIPNPGKQISDFRPGENLENIFSVYVYAASLDPTQPSALKVISQAQQLALSTCARKSNGRLWCGTCHDPHRQPANAKAAKAWFRSRCLACHGTALLEKHPKPNEDCIGCHMQRRPVSDGGHTVFTDHRIARRPPSGHDTSEREKPDSLVAWHEPPEGLRQRNLGLAEIEVGERTKNLALVSQGSKRLMECWSKFPQDPPVLTSIGQVLLGVGDAKEAGEVFERSIQAQPDDAANYLHAALAWKAAHEPERAISSLEKALRLDPVLQQPYLELADIYANEHQPEMVHLTYERYLKAFPQSVDAQKRVHDSALHEPGSAAR
jgi:tetratricopeptide (TPR) repeat protein